MKPVLTCVWLGWSSACYFFFRWRSVRWFEWKNNEECCVAVGRTANISRSVSTSHVVSLVVLLFHWLSCCFIDCLVVSLVVLLFNGCLVVSLVVLLFHFYPVVLLVVLLFHWLSCCIIGYHVVSLVVLLFHWLSCCFIGYHVVSLVVLLSTSNGSVYSRGQGSSLFVVIILLRLFSFALATLGWGTCDYLFAW